MAFILKNKHLFILAVICLGFFAIESLHSKQYSYIEVDEIKSIMTSVGFDQSTINSVTKDSTFNQSYFLGENNIQSVIRNNIVGESGNCIAYNLSLHMWLNIFDSSLYSARMFSLLFGIGIIIVAFYLGITLFDNKNLGLLISLLIASSRSMMDYGILVRTYSMAIFFSLLATLLYIKWIRSIELSSNTKLITKKSIYYGIISGISMLTHYFCLYILMIHALFLIPHLLRRETKNKIALFFPYVISAVVITPWMLIGGLKGLSYMAGGNEWHLAYAKSSNPLASMTQLTSIQNTITYIKKIALEWTYNGRYWDYFQFNIKMRYILIILVIPFIFLCVSLINLLRKKSKDLFLLFSLFIIGPIFCIVLAFQSGHTVSFSDRYTLMSFPYFIIIISYGIYQLQSKSGLWRIVTLSLCTLFALNIIFQTKLQADDVAKKFEPHFLRMNYSVQKQLGVTKDLQSKIIEFPYIWVALYFNFNFIPSQMEIKQRINPQLEKNKVYLFDTLTKKRIVLYELPKDFDATPNYHAK